jgi:phosphate uptake regulator
MEIRKVQMTGGSSYNITLPKEWVKLLGIKKNDSLGLMVQPDGTLLVTANAVQEQPQRVKEFKVDDIDDREYLFRLLVGAYIMGYSEIAIKSKRKMPLFVRDCIIEFTQSAIGPEIIEETSNFIIIKDLLNPAEMPFDKTIRRMYLLVKSMHEDVIAAFKEKDKSLALVVPKRDTDVDRLHWLIARQTNLGLRDITLAKKMDTTPEAATYYFLISRIIERVGDHAVRISKNVPVLIEKNISPNIVNDIATATVEAVKIFSNSIDSWKKRDIHAANKNIDAVAKLVPLCKKLNNAAMKVKGEAAIATNNIAESIRRTGEYSGDISELVINYLVSR